MKVANTPTERAQGAVHMVNEKEKKNVADLSK